nr:MAG: major capsid protein [Microvirus sp.]
MGNLFNSVQIKTPSSNTFDLSYDHKMSMRMGNLVPFHVQECVPGDSFSIRTEAMLRVAPLLAPIMHKVDVYMHYFFVPNRILWDDWETFITGGQKPDDSPAFPTLNFNSVALGQINIVPSSLPNYLGLPVVPDMGSVSALPFAAYQKIWYEFYRDQNLQETEFPVLREGEQTSDVFIALTQMQQRAWAHDYFTSALPFAQKGESVDIPISFEGVDFDVVLKDVADRTNIPIWRDAITNLPTSSSDFIGTGFSGETRNVGGDILFPDLGDYYKATGNGSGNVDSTINDLRTAYALQRWLEKNARAGTRYTESILAHFGVRSSDKRLQRPEYMGGSKQALVISEVLQTSSPETDHETPLGTMAGHGISVGSTGNVKYRCEEHGYIIGLMSILPRTAYFQGLPKHFSKFDRMQYFWPDFANLGEQEILNKELYYSQSDGLNNDVFGYTPRYAEYKFNMSRVSGDFATTLDYWHMARKFGNRPRLNEEFIVSDPTKRIFAVTDPTEDDVYIHTYSNIMARRPMPKYGTPI